MTTEQLKRARAMKAEEKSYREIATTLGLSVVTVWRALRTKDEQSPEVESEVSLQSSLVESESTDALLSHVIAARIAETRERIPRAEGELSLLAQEKERILGGISVNDDAIDELEEKEAALVKALPNLRARLVLLQHEQEKAETEEADARNEAIAARTQQIKTESETALRVYQQTEDAFTQALNALVALYTEADSLAQEMEYLCERYGVSRRELANLEKLPNREEAIQRTFAGLNRYWLRQERGKDEWSQKLDALLTERLKRDRENQQLHKNEPLYTPIVMNR